MESKTERWGRTIAVAKAHAFVGVVYTALNTIPDCDHLVFTYPFGDAVPQH